MNANEAPTPLAAALKQAQAESNVDAVNALARSALQNKSDDLRALVDVAIHLRYSHPSESDAVLEYILRRDPQSAFGHYELAFSRMLQGRHIEAALLLESMLLHHPSDPRAILLLAKLFCGIGASDFASKLLQKNRSIVQQGESIIIEQFAAYIERFSRQKVLYLAGRYRLEHVSIIKEKIQAALRDRLGFSLVRFGDGEGVFFRGCHDEEDMLADLLTATRRDRAKVWFGDELDTIISEFMPQALRISDVFDTCDIAGVPYPSWIEHEFKILSLSGVVGLTNIIRHIPNSSYKQKLFCSQLVHIDLAQSGALREILSAVSSCSIISCFEGAPDFLKSSFGIQDVEFHPIPGEKLILNGIDPAAANGRHFPDRFEALMKELEKPAHGRLFLVAAGILGKFYCAQIKNAGGVAVDIGSLIDASLGKATRPGYSTSKPLIW